MITEVRAARMVVLSDLHLGNPCFDNKARVLAFLRWAAAEGYDICINGDGLEIAQVSFTRLAQDVPDVLHTLKQITRRGTRVFYVVGNHDIVMEHFLNDWGSFHVTPFLNLESGDARIRVEHGHLYDPFFVGWPRTYELVTRVSGWFLAIAPWLYSWWTAWERLKSRFLWGAGRDGIVGEHPAFADAAYELGRRGFDVVIFGHTHHTGRRALRGDTVYLNPGSWLMGTVYVEIVDGVARLREWTRSR